jgi:two-component system, NtrC family, sensor kinase
MRCPRCQHENRPQATFCEACGTPLSANPTAPPGPSYAEITSALSEALEQQTATSEILRVISRSPTDVQPAFEAIAAKALDLCRATTGWVYTFDGALIHVAAAHGLSPEGIEARRQSYPMPPSRGGGTSRAVLSQTIVYIPDIRKDHEYTLQPLAKAADYLSVLAVPMLREGKPIGVITVTGAEAGAFSQRQLELLETFADQAVIAIENVRLFTEVQEKNRALTEAHAQVSEALEQQTATSEILRVISSSPTDLQPVLEVVVKSAVRFCGADDAIILRLDGETLWAAAHHGPIPVDFGLPVPCVRGTVGGRSVLERRAVHVSDLQVEAEEFPEGSAFAKRLGARTTLGVPLLREGTAVGTIQLRRAQVDPFTDKQIELLRTFADQAVIAIENVRLFKELEARNRDLTEALDQQTATAEILRVIASSPTDVQPVFDIAASAARLCEAAEGTVYRFDGDLIHMVAYHGGDLNGLEVLKRVFPRPPGRGTIVGRAILTGTVVQADITRDPEHEFREIAGIFRTVLGVPMLRDGVVIGAIDVSRRDDRPFSTKQIALLETFATQAVIAIENVRLFKELQVRTAELTRSVDQLTALGEVGRAVSSTLDLATVLTTIVSRAVELSGLDGGLVSEYDEIAEEFVQRATAEIGEGLPQALREVRYQKGEGAIGRIAITREPFQVPDITIPGLYESRVRETLIESGVRAVLAVPMIHQNRLIGCLGVTRKRPGEFPTETIDLLRTFATQSALAIQNARLFQEIADKSRQLEAASHHKSEFLANMSHELRTPLNAILGFSEVLAEQMFGEVNEKQAEYLQDILSSGRHLLSLINDILDLSKVEAGRLELELDRFHLPTALDNALTLVRERATRHGITLTQTVDHRIGDIVADERKVKQILLNLLSNAVKFTPEGGRVGLTATAAEDGITIAVSDTGIGIAPEDQAAIFEEFRQVGRDDTRTQEGTGLGLTLAKKFVELHGGRIWLQSQVGPRARRSASRCPLSLTKGVRAIRAEARPHGHDVPPVPRREPRRAAVLRGLR